MISAEMLREAMEAQMDDTSGKMRNVSEFLITDYGENDYVEFDLVKMADDLNKKSGMAGKLETYWHEALSASPFVYGSSSWEKYMLDAGADHRDIDQRIWKARIKACIDQLTK